MFTFGSLFAGIGGIDLGLERAGMTCRWQVEIDDYATKVLEKHWPDVTRFRDVRDCGRHNLESVDLIAGGFPCQDVSIAGKRKGLKGERTTLWTEFYRIICEIGPDWALVENVPGLLSSDNGRFLGKILRDLAKGGFNAEWGIVPACAFGAPHSRERLFLIAYSNKVRRWTTRIVPERFYEFRSRCDNWKTAPTDYRWQNVELWINSIMVTHNRKTNAATSSGMVDGISDRLDRIGALGNAVVPQIAQLLGEIIVEVNNANRKDLDGQNTILD